MLKTKLSAFISLILVFASGVLVGGVAHRLYMVNTVFSGPKPEEVRHKIVEEMRTRLSLTDQQVTQLSAIMDTTKARFHEVRSKWDKEAKIRAKPELKAIQEDQVQKIKEILTEAQRPEYDKYRADREKQRKAAASHPANQ